MLSLIYPINNALDARLPLFRITLKSIEAYSAEIRDRFEILVIDSQADPTVKAFVISQKGTFDITYVSYDHPNAAEGKHHSPVYALNLGVQLAKYDSVILSSPEVRHETPVLKQLMDLTGQNILCRTTEEGAVIVPRAVSEIGPDGARRKVLMGNDMPARKDDPGYFFVGMYNKSDYVAVGGLDENMMTGLGWEDNDFGWRFHSMFPHTTRDDIKCVHQYHPRVLGTQSPAFQKNNTYMKAQKAIGKVVVNTERIMGDPKYIMEKI